MKFNHKNINSMKKKNPFRFGKIVRDDNFCNRKKEIKALKQYIRDGYSVWLYSPRRYGKSSLIYKVFDELTDTKVIYFDFYNVQSVDNFCRKYSKLLAKELFDWKQNIKTLTKNLAEYFRNLYPKVSFDETGTPSFSLEIKQIEEQSDVEQILNIPEIIARKNNQFICIAFDEFQEIERIDPFIINWMRSAFQKQENVSYVFLGSKQSLMRSIFSSVNSPFYEFAVKMNIEPILFDNLFMFINNKFTQQGLHITEKNIKQILEVSEGHPHFTQYFASVVFDLLRGGEDQNNRNFKDLWLNKIINSQSLIFQNIFDQLNNNQRMTLSAIALFDKDTEIFSTDVRNKYHLPPSSSLSTTLQALIKKNLIHKENNSYKIINPVLKEWIKQII